MDVIKNYAKTVKLVESGQYGKTQVINCYVNTLKEGDALVQTVYNQLCLLDGIMGSSVEKESVNLFSNPYKNGFVVREYANKGLVRYTFAAAPMSEREEIIVYANDGEVRLDGAEGKIGTLIQSPDLDPTPFTEEVDVEGIIDFSLGKIGNSTLSDEQIKNNLAIASKIASL